MRGAGHHVDKKSTSVEVVHSPYFRPIALDFLVRGDPHACPYLPDRKAVEEAFRVREFHPELYHDFMDHGFRRSGSIFYRPRCPDCRECRMLRVPVESFRPSKSMRRVMRKNEDLTMTVGPPRLTAEKCRMYAAYLAERHDSRPKDPENDLRSFLYSSPVFSVEFQYRSGSTLVAVSIADLCSRSLSSVYTFFDPDFSDRSPGSYSAVQEIRFCNENGIPYYYLGFHVKDCGAMSYKARFKPHQLLASAPDAVWLDPETAAR